MQLPGISLIALPRFSSIRQVARKWLIRRPTVLSGVRFTFRLRPLSYSAMRYRRCWNLRLFRPFDVTYVQPFSRRTHRLECRRSEKTFGLSNDSFLLDDLPSSSCRKSHVTDAASTAACTFDHYDTDDDGQLIDSCVTSPCVALPGTDSDCRTDQLPSSSTTTCVVIERAASTGDLNDDEQQPVSDERDDVITLQQSATAPASS